MTAWFDAAVYPLLDGYGLSPRAVTEPSGPAGSPPRRISGLSGADLTLSYLFTADQYADFRAWWDAAMLDSARVTGLPIQTPALGAATISGTITSDTFTAELVGADSWRVSFGVLSAESLTMSQADFETWDAWVAWTGSIDEDYALSLWIIDLVENMMPQL